MKGVKMLAIILMMSFVMIAHCYADLLMYEGDARWFDSNGGIIKAEVRTWAIEPTVQDRAAGIRWWRHQVVIHKFLCDEYVVVEARYYCRYKQRVSVEFSVKEGGKYCKKTHATVNIYDNGMVDYERACDLVTRLVDQLVIAFP